MFVTFLDQLWVWMGLQQEELREERGRGLVYAVVLVAGVASVVLAADMILNLSGRFG